MHDANHCDVEQTMVARAHKNKCNLFLCAYDGSHCTWTIAMQLSMQNHALRLSEDCMSTWFTTTPMYYSECTKKLQCCELKRLVRLYNNRLYTKRKYRKKMSCENI